MTARVGVVMITHGRRARVLATLRRLTELPEQPPIVVVDNASADGTAAAVARAHPSVTVVRLAENRGAAARTAGVRHLNTEAVAFCDDDSWYAPGALRIAGELMAADPRLALIAARVLVGAEQQIDPTCTLMGRSPLAPWGGSSGSSKHWPGPPVLGFVACGAVVRRSAYLQVGGFHPRYGVGGEEWLLALDLATRGWRLAYVESVVAHHHPAATGHDRPERRRQVLRNDLWTAWLRLPLGAAASRTALLTLNAARHQNLRALPAAAAGVPWVLRGRRVVPAGVGAAAARLAAE